MVKAKNKKYLKIKVKAIYTVCMYVCVYIYIYIYIYIYNKIVICVYSSYKNKMKTENIKSIQIKVKNKIILK